MTQDNESLLEEIDIDNLNGDRVLGIDGDIILYKPCCVLNDDSDMDRAKIAEIVQSQIQQMLIDARCDKYYFFVTTSTNFRDHIVDDYKANRKDVVRPVNLKWAKQWAVANLNAVWKAGMEADDLLGIFAEQHDHPVIWSLDKDLRQIPGEHLDDETRQIVTVTKLGKLQDKGKKTYFDGGCGFYYQLLVGDGADHIIGCGARVTKVYKSGKKKGESYVARSGVGPKEALGIITEAVVSVLNGTDSLKLATVHAAVGAKYKELHGANWQVELENNANLLFMVREMREDVVPSGVIKQWTYDGRDSYMNIKTGVVFNDLADAATT